MKGIKFFVMTILAAAMPMLISSCKPNNQPDDTTGGGGTGAATIVGSWELVDAQKSNSEGALWVLEGFGRENHGQRRSLVRDDVLLYVECFL